MGSSPIIQLTLSLINTFCIPPILCYELEAMRLTKTQLNSLSFPYNSGFMKLFTSYNIDIITLCQYYSGYVPFTYLYHLNCLKFYITLNASHDTPAGLLFKLFGNSERDKIAQVYNLSNVGLHNSFSLRDIFWKVFERHCKAM